MKVLIAKMLTSADDQVVRSCLESAEIVPANPYSAGGLYILNGSIGMTDSIYHDGCTHIHTKGGGKKTNRTAIRQFKDFKRLAEKEAS